VYGETSQWVGRWRVKFPRGDTLVRVNEMGGEGRRKKYYRGVVFESLGLSWGIWRWKDTCLFLCFSSIFVLYPGFLPVFAGKVELCSIPFFSCFVF